MARARWYPTAGTAALCAGLLLLGPAAAARDGLDEGSHSRFVVSDTGVTATVSVTITNSTANTYFGDGSYTYYYYDGYSLTVPAGAENVRATSRGADLPVRLEPSESPGLAFATVSFSSLTQGQTRVIDWSYTIPGEPFRSEDFTRVGPGYASFVAQGTGDPGEVTVEVVLPEAMEFDGSADGYTSHAEGGTVTHTTTQHTDEYGVWTVVSARNPEQADKKTVTVGDLSLQVESFPGDTEWAAFAEQKITTGLPVITDIIGRPWPGGLTVVREDVVPNAIGYAWFDPSAKEIVVGEDLDEATLFHELTHAWVNSESFEGRWLSEGLTEVVAHRAVAKVGGTSEPWTAPDRNGEGSLALVDWNDDAMGTPADEYAYPASFAAVQDLVGDLDDAALADIIGTARDGGSAYDVPGSSVQRQGTTDWRGFLDLVEVRGGVTDAPDILRTWVLGAEEAGQLDQRAQARAAYAAVDEADGAWHPPLGLRAAMTRWDFDGAQTTTAAVEGLPEAAVEVQRAAEKWGLPVPGLVRGAYEGADEMPDYAELAGLLPEAEAAVDAVGAASAEVASEANPVSELGEALLGADDAADDARSALAAGELAAASGIADSVNVRSRFALAAGAVTIVLALALLGGVVLIAVLALRRRAARVAEPVAGPAGLLPGAAGPEAGEAEADAEAPAQAEPETEPAGQAAPEPKADPDPEAAVGPKA